MWWFAVQPGVRLCPKFVDTRSPKKEDPCRYLLRYPTVEDSKNAKKYEN